MGVGKNAVCSCPTGYALHSNKKTCIADGFKLKGDGFYYKYFKAAKNYNAAQADCRKYNGNLAIIWNDVTSKIVRSIMAHGWIGGSDQKNEGKWITPDTPWDPRRGNKNLPWKNWNRGEPNNAGNEDCLHQLTSRKWNNVKEPLSLYFSAAAADNTSSAKSNITRRRNNRKQTTLKRNNRKNKQHKTKQYKRISPFINLGNFLCAQSITFHRKRES